MIPFASKMINDYRIEQFVGGQLENFQDRWKEMGASEHILRMISGTRIPLTSRPPLTQDWRNTKFITVPSQAMSEQIQLLLQQKVLEIPSRVHYSFISRMFLVPKPSGGIRQIFDLRGLNEHVKVTKFSLLSQVQIPDFLQPGDWMVKIDLAQAYFHVPIAESHRNLLRLVYKGTLYQMTCLPFGLSSAPHIFATITNWIAEILRARGVRVIVYLDDFLLASQNRANLSLQTAEALGILRHLGWFIKDEKCILEPCQEMEYLGLVWNTLTGQIQLPLNKIRSIQEILKKVESERSCTLKLLQSLLGHLNFANLAVYRGRLHCRYLQRFSCQFRQNRQREKLPLPQSVLNELTWWKTGLASTTPLHKKSVTHFLTTDAADSGWGAQLNNSHQSGSWTTKQSSWHSNKKEMYAVYATLKENASNLKNAHVLLQTDNRTLVAYINKEGGTRSIDLLDLTYQVLTIVDSMNITLSAAYIPGRYNGIADRLSRKKSLPEWHLLSEARHQIFRQWGVPEIDLFASKMSAVVKKYVTIDSRDHQATFIDAFSQIWKFNLAWIFPPPNLIPRVLAHLNHCQGQFILIAPKWDQTFWMADLMNKSQKSPITIKDLDRYLIDLSTGQPPSQVEKIILQAWMIGCGQT